MKRLVRTLAVGALALCFAFGPAIVAQDHHDDQHQQAHHDKYVRHQDWKKGSRIRKEDWDRGVRVDDWQARHLRRPPHGYEWRDVDGQYILANPSGVIFQVTIG